MQTVQTVETTLSGICYVQQNNIKLIDFGFARADMFPVDGQFKRSDTYCGSYAYAAPEILMGSPYVPQMSDVWSLGVILYIMASHLSTYRAYIYFISHSNTIQ